MSRPGPGILTIMEPTTDTEISKYQGGIREGQKQSFKKIWEITKPLIPGEWIEGSSKAISDSIDKGDKSKFLLEASSALLYFACDASTLVSLGSSKYLSNAVRMAKSDSKLVYKIIENTKQLFKEYSPRKEEIKEVNEGIKKMLELIEKGIARFGDSENLLVKSSELIEHKSTSHVWKLLNENVTGLKRGEVPDSIMRIWKQLDGLPAEIITLDKKSVWNINTFGKKYGDLALSIYFNSIDNVGKKLKHIYGDVLQIDAVRTGADEVIVVIRGISSDELTKASKIFKKELEDNLSISSKYMKEEFAEVFKGVSFESTQAQIYAKKDVFGFTIMGEHHKEVYSLSQIASNREIRSHYDKFIEYLKKSGVPENNIENHPFITYLRKISDKTSEVKTLSSTNIKEPLTGIMGYRLSFKETEQEILKKFSLAQGKGFDQTFFNRLGPSSLNDLGHHFVDYLNSELAENLYLVAKKYNVKVIITQPGPMQLAYKFETKDKNLIKKILSEAEKNSLKKVEPLGVTKIVSHHKLTSKYTGKSLSNSINLFFDNSEKLIASIKKNKEVVKTVNHVIASNYQSLLAHNTFSKSFNNIRNNEVKLFLESITLSDPIRNVDGLVAFSLSKGKDEKFIKELINELYDIW